MALPPLPSKFYGLVPPPYLAPATLPEPLEPLTGVPCAQTCPVLGQAGLVTVEYRAGKQKALKAVFVYIEKKKSCYLK